MPPALERRRDGRFKTLANLLEVACVPVESHPDRSHRFYERITNTNAEAGLFDWEGITKAVVPTLAFERDALQWLALRWVDFNEYSLILRAMSNAQLDWSNENRKSKIDGWLRKP